MDDLASRMSKDAKNRAEEFLSYFKDRIKIQTALCPTYSALLRGEPGSVVDLDDILDIAMRRGRVILSGRGASGKSALVHELVIRAFERGFTPFILNLSRWDQHASDNWKELRENPRDAFDFLLRNFSASEHDLTDVEFLPVGLDKLFFIDGLNETPGSTADEILTACDQIASLMIRSSVVVTDRLVRRNLDFERKWVFVMPLPVQQNEIDRLVDGQQVPPGAASLLSSPFFLDRAIQGELRGSPLATMQEMLEVRGGLDCNGLIAASQIAFEAYQHDQSRTFSVARFVDAGIETVAKTLTAAGILIPVKESLVSFSHHWYHDYLASKFVVSHPDLLSYNKRHCTLDVLTFKANSFDAIAFALELLRQDPSGEFLYAVYDWNPYAVGYALAEARIGEDDVPRDVRLMIIAMLAERRFDRHFHSARRAGDALDLLKDNDAVQLRAAASRADLLALISKIDIHGEVYNRWSELFTLKEAASAPPELIPALENEVSVIGWTAANVLKRVRLSEADEDALRAMAKSSVPVVRWRSVHALGSTCAAQTIETLFDRLDNDSDENVRYGAIRSLVEVASRAPDQLAKIVDKIIERLPQILHSPRIISELCRVVFLAPGFAPPNWVEEISRVFYALLEREDSMLEAEQWSRLASRIRVHHRSESELAA